MPKLGVNIDHVATLRQARGGIEPDTIEAALICEKAGCDSIVAHLREDRRHINDRDVFELRKRINTRFNLEMSINPEIVDIALKLGPDQVTLVPEKRQELTTEGGLSVIKFEKKLAKITALFNKKGIDVSVFIGPDKNEIRSAIYIGIGTIEIHTGEYSLAKDKKSMAREFKKIKDSAEYAMSRDIIVNAGHGLNYMNVKPIADIKGINELNIGHSIISRAVFTGLCQAVQDMKALCS
ncbi:MAG: pyridoxine 5'-phosphate synthase [Omnitrophica bacterium GWA2_41_15]|nr:MAG: pyridoxine 5'-phosphate synthase [Omnitrophica bacterium GWA2_41_15]HAZ10925.1 pyridoxine 5'-phosphate synthase [Candidatus Omnitrophota bacterium]